MKIKNLKMNKKKIVGLASCVLVGSFLTGCGIERTAILGDSLLERAIVVTFEDGSHDIAKLIETCEDEFGHYRSIVSGEYYGSSNCNHKEISNIRIMPMNHYPIVNVENITKYLKADELEKMLNGDLQVKNVLDIVTRINSEEIKEKTFIKAK